MSIVSDRGGLYRPVTDHCHSRTHQFIGLVREEIVPTRIIPCVLTQSLSYQALKTAHPLALMPAELSRQLNSFAICRTVTRTKSPATLLPILGRPHIA
jgi:hypothetical protein